MGQEALVEHDRAWEAAVVVVALAAVAAGTAAISDSFADPAHYGTQCVGLGTARVAVALAAAAAFVDIADIVEVVWRLLFWLASVKAHT